MVHSNNNHQVLASLLDQAYLEVFPTRTIMDRLIHIPRHSYVSITCSPVHGLEPTLKLVEKLDSAHRGQDDPGQGPPA